ncbi:MAG TPA: hypothetical protein VF607_04835, partial [Verrucomicrobiae bacterium]
MNKFISLTSGGMSCFRWPLWLAILLSGTLSPAMADQIKANNNVSLEQAGSWAGNTPPGGLEWAIWNNGITTAANATNLLGGAATWGGIVISNPVVPVVINGNTTLTLSNGINLSAATVDLT